MQEGELQKRVERLEGRVLVQEGRYAGYMQHFETRLEYVERQLQIALAEKPAESK